MIKEKRLNNDTTLIICKNDEIIKLFMNIKESYKKSTVQILKTDEDIDAFLSRHYAWHNARGAGDYVGIISVEDAEKTPDLEYLETFSLVLSESVSKMREKSNYDFINKLNPLNTVICDIQQV